MWKGKTQFENPGRTSVTVLVISTHGTEELALIVFWAPVATWTEKGSECLAGLNPEWEMHSD